MLENLNATKNLQLTCLCFCVLVSACTYHAWLAYLLFAGQVNEVK